MSTRGIRILGLGGSMNYNDGAYQYEEKEMKKRAKKQKFSLLRHGGIDILLTHAPARNINDGEDLPHRGFETFCHLLNRYQPRYFIHGHVHKNYGGDFSTDMTGISPRRLSTPMNIASLTMRTVVFDHNFFEFLVTCVIAESSHMV